MNRIIFAVLFFIIASSIIAQEDIIVINKDTLKCRIVENTLDWVSCISYGELVKLSPDCMTKGDVKMATPLSINYIKFSEKSGCSYTTSYLMKKLDFSANSPNTKWGMDSITHTVYEMGFDTANNRLFWFGLDFSMVSITLGKASRADYDQLFFLDCNDYLASPAHFNDFKKLFSFILDTSIVTTRNDNINLRYLYNRPPQNIALDSIRNIIAGFDVSYKGVGLIVFITEINKETEAETFYITFFDIESKTVLLSLKETGKAVGIGMALHWTKPIQDNLNFLVNNNIWKRKYK